MHRLHFHVPRIAAILAVAFVVVLPMFPGAGPTSAAERAGPHALVVPGDIDRAALVRERASRHAELSRTRQVRPAPGPVTGWWGERRRRHLHTGFDINGETGDPVVSAMHGTVVHAGGAPKGYSGYGETVIVDHGEFQTLYAHLSRIDVAAGQIVEAGQLIGAIGTTGRVTGSHLHFEVRINGEPVDPEAYIHVLR